MHRKSLIKLMLGLSLTITILSGCAFGKLNRQIRPFYRENGLNGEVKWGDTHSYLFSNLYPLVYSEKVAGKKVSVDDYLEYDRQTGSLWKTKQTRDNMPTKKAIAQHRFGRLTNQSFRGIPTVIWQKPAGKRVLATVLADIKQLPGQNLSHFTVDTGYLESLTVKSKINYQDYYQMVAQNRRSNKNKQRAFMGYYAVDVQRALADHFFYVSADFEYRLPQNVTATSKLGKQMTAAKLAELKTTLQQMRFKYQDDMILIVGFSTQGAKKTKTWSTSDRVAVEINHGKVVKVF